MVRYYIVGTTILIALCSGCFQGVDTKRDIHGQMALHRAASENRVEEVEKLLKEGANPNVQDVDGVAPLHRIARDGNLALAKLFLDNRADPCMATKDGWDPLQLAVWHDHPGMVDLLISYRANPARKTAQGWTALHLAAIKGEPEIIQTLLKDWPSYKSTGKPDINEKDAKGDTPLLLAIKHKQPGALQALIIEGADPNLADAHNEAPIHLLVDSGATELVVQLLNHQANINVPNAAGKTPFVLAQGKNNTALMQLLWDRGGR